MPTDEGFNPYVGPVPFSDKKKDFFFGREKETELLLSLAISERVVLFYAQSGAGKSSLIHAGLIPGLKSYGYRVWPIVRVSGQMPRDLDVDKVDNVYVFNALCSLSDSKKKYKELVNKPLSSFATGETRGAAAEPHWLIVDQFEEILTAHPEQYERRADFFRQLKDALDADKMLSVVLAMREDYIAGLDNYASLLPGRLGVRFRMEPLKRAAAEEAVKRPAEKAGRRFAEGVAESLVRELSMVRVGGGEEAEPAAGGDAEAAGQFGPGEYVEPVQLQIVCFDLWKRLEKAGAGEVITEYGDIDTALESYYDNAVEETARRTKDTPNAIRRWFAEKLITPTGIRSQVNRSYLKTGGLSNSAVDILDTEYRLIRYLEVRGGKWYELAHDRYIAPILRANDRWLSQGRSPFYADAKAWHAHREEGSFLYRGHRLREALKWAERNRQDLSEIETAFLNASNISETKRSTWLKAAVVLLVALLGAALGGLVYALDQRRLATSKAAEAQQLRVIAEERAKAEVGLRTEATRERELAEVRGVELEEKNRQLEDKQKELEDALKAADRERLAAVAAQKQEARQRHLAEEQSRLADGRLAALTESQERERLAAEQAERARESLPQTFINTVHDYSRRLGLPPPDPDIFFSASRKFEFSAMWNGSKLQYEVNYKYLRMRGLAEFVALEGRYREKHARQCGSGVSADKQAAWLDLGTAVTDYMLQTETSLSGDEGPPVRWGGRGYFNTYQVFKRMEAGLGGDTQPVRKFALAFLDRHQCNWSPGDIPEHARDLNRRLGLMPDEVVVDAFKVYGN